jgi:thiol-disulfide isomerase/thioredoxin
MFRNLYLTVVIILVMSITGLSQNRSIAFENKPFDEVLEMAGKAGKLVFMDAYASWCGPCKWMSANIFTNDSVADFFNSHFICIKMDMEKGEGINLSQIYQVRAYPTLLFINASGNMVHKRVGAPQAVSDYIVMAKAAMSPDRNLSALQNSYSSGEKNPEFIYLYLKTLSEAYMPVTSVLSGYFASVNRDDLVSAANWKIIFGFCNDKDSPEFKYLVSHQKEFEKKHGRDSVDAKISSVYVKSILDLAKSGSINDSSYAALKREITQSGFSGAPKVIFDADISLAQMKGDSQAFLELVSKDLNKFYSNDPLMLNNVAWYVHELSRDKKYLEKALEWAARSVELKPEASNCDTYGALLYDLGRKEEAIKSCSRALELARKNNQPTEQIEENLRKYQAGK